MSDSSDKFSRLAESDYEVWLYADWRELGDVERGRKYATALRRSIHMKVAQMQAGGAGGEMLRNDLVNERKMLEETERAIGMATAAQSQQSFVDFSCYRR